MKKILLYFFVAVILIGLTTLAQKTGYTLYQKDYFFMIGIALFCWIILETKIYGLKKKNTTINIFFVYTTFFIKIVILITLYLACYLKTNRVLLGFFILLVHYTVYNIVEIYLVKKEKLS